jgi:hypothetical protein
MRYNLSQADVKDYKAGLLIDIEFDATTIAAPNVRRALRSRG